VTLARQIFTASVLLLALAFSGTFLIAVHGTRAYLATQLQSHAQDAATALGLSLSPHLAAGDRATLESMINAVFDRGDYLEITLVDVAGAPLLRRTRELRVAGVPAWFVEALALGAPRAEAVVMDGWRQGGWVRVASHPGYAYAELWASARDTLAWTLGALLVAALAIWGLLRLVLRPLRAVEAQALAIARREFPALDPVPRTRELARVVVAMNAMARKLGQTLAEQSAEAERLRAQAFTDPLTGVGNRRAFSGRIEALTGAGEAPGQGALLLVRLGGLDQVNRLHGHAAGDQLLRVAAARLEAVIEDPGGPFLARLQGAEFAATLPGLGAAEAERTAQAVLDALATLAPGDGLTVHVGVAYAAAGEAPAAVLARADAALRAAQAAGPVRWQGELAAADGPRAAPLGAEAWRAVLAEALGGPALGLLAMPYRACPGGAPVPGELLARLSLPGQQALPAALFVPMAERLGFAACLDRQVIERALARLEAGAGEHAVNLCASSVLDTELLDWLHGRLAAAPGAAARLVLELAEHGAARAPGAWGELIERLAPLGVRFGVDRFGLGASLLGRLRDLRLAYLKLDPAVVRQVASGRSEQFFVKLVCDLARTLDMRVLATGVETRAQWERLCALGVAGGAGSYLGAPRPLEEPG
jgi:diguanylate cyclase (GGDEF)-like protein